jgi:hypothetical protein
MGATVMQPSAPSTPMPQVAATPLYLASTIAIFCPDSGSLRPRLHE